MEIHQLQIKIYNWGGAILPWAVENRLQVPSFTAGKWDKVSPYQFKED